MCWQCGSKPNQWLSIFESFQPIGWWFGPGTRDGVFEFILEGQHYHTNPQVDMVENMVDHIPGEFDVNGDAWFLVGHYLPLEGDKFRKEF